MSSKEAPDVHYEESRSRNTSPSSLRIANILLNLTCAQIVNSFATGVLVVAIPVIAQEIHLDQSLVFWPQAIYSLTCACSLIAFGAIADVVGSKKIFLSGAGFLCIMNIACSRSQSGTELIAFRACLGLGTAMCQPSAISIISHMIKATSQAEEQITTKTTRGIDDISSVDTALQKQIERRKAFKTFGLAMQGLGLPLGFSLGLLLGGYLTDSPLTWRFGFYLNAGLNFLILLHGIFILPRDEEDKKFSFKSLTARVDFLGVFLSVLILAPLLTAFAFIAADSNSIHKAYVIVLIVISVIFAPLFPLWMHHGENHGRQVLLPNSLWRNKVFTCMCIMVLLSWGTVQSLEVFLSLFYQNIQSLSAQQSSLRYIPDVVLGIIVNMLTGLLLPKIYAYPLILTALSLSSISPLLAALTNPSWPYWYTLFWVVLLSPISVDVLFTVASCFITGAMDKSRQAMAGAVFSTCSQLGVSLGLGIFALVSSTVAQGHEDNNGRSNGQKSNNEAGLSTPALLQGYRAAFWTMLAWSLISLAIGIFALRKIDRLGVGKMRKPKHTS